MRFIKLTLAFLFAAALFISLAYSARTKIISYSLDSYLTEYQAELTCADFTVTSSLDIVITKACIKIPQADIELKNSLIALSSSLEFTKVEVGSLSITGKAKFLPPKTKKVNNNKEDLQDYLTQIAKLNLAIPIEIEKFTYKPFIANSLKKNTSNKTIYSGHVTANENTFELSLKINEQVDILSAQLMSKCKSFTTKINTDLAQLRSFLAIHQVSLPKELGTKTTTLGQFNSQITWQNNELIANSQLKEFSVENYTGINESGPFKVNGTLAWQTRITDTKGQPSQLKIEIADTSTIGFKYDEQALINYLTQQNSSAELISIIKANPTKGLIIKPQANIEIDFNKQKLKVSHIEIVTNSAAHNAADTAENSTVPLLQLTLSDAVMNYQTEQKFRVNLNKVKFEIDTKLTIDQLNNLTEEPLKITSSGTIEQLNNKWKITLPTDSTQVSLSKLIFAKGNNTEISLESSIENNIERNTANKLESMATIDNFFTFFHGDIFVNNEGIESYSLESTSNATHFKAGKIAAIEELQLRAKIKGESESINITANVKADKQPISTIKVIGNLNQPNVEIFANSLALTDLLSLDLKLPMNVELIDGSLSYHFSGKLKDVGNLLNNSAILTVSIADMSGEVDNTWIHGLNWQQNLSINQGEITTITEPKSKNKDKRKSKSKRNNFTIAKIDTSPSLSNISAQTSISYQENSFALFATDLKAELLGGNIKIDKAQWPFSIKHSVNVQLTSIDLTKLLELDPKQGIIVTGNISGDLPVNYNGKNFMIVGGKLHNIDNGIIKVADNPTVEQLKLDDPQLKLAFDAMQNLHYHLLTSDVSMDDTGYMLFDTTIKGRNPDIDNDVTLNLNLNYDLMGLLESLNITSQIEQKLIDRLQKN